MNLIDLFVIGAIIHLSILAHHLVTHTMQCPTCNQTPPADNPKRKFLLDYLDRWDKLIQDNPTQINLSTRMRSWLSNTEAKSLQDTTKPSAHPDMRPPRLAVASRAQELLSSGRNLCPEDTTAKCLPHTGPTAPNGNTPLLN